MTDNWKVISEQSDSLIGTRRMTEDAVSEAKTIWDIPISSLFSLVHEFYRKEKDHLSLDYGQRIKLLAFYKQEKLGPYSPEKDAETGYFDVVGADRRKAWIALGSMNQEKARQGLISLLDAATPKLREYVLEQWKARKTREKPRAEKGKRETSKVPQDQGEANHAEVLPPHPVNGHHETEPPSPPTSEPKSVLAPATLWCTPRAAKQFVNQVRTSPDSQLLINPGESIDVQVPTSTEASAIFWEFVTESGDVGFGLSFQRRSERPGHQSPVQELLPVVRRDCSEDLILGSHQYQSQGTYFLRFDNSHSPNTPKVVCYKVFYQRTT